LLSQVLYKIGKTYLKGLRHNCRAYAADQHFEAMEKHLGLRLYTPGYNGSFEPES
jgi:hypothetical protein